MEPMCRIVVLSPLGFVGRESKSSCDKELHYTIQSKDNEVAPLLLLLHRRYPEDTHTSCMYDMHR